MKKHGTLMKWYPQRYYGFIDEADHKGVFVHGTDVSNAAKLGVGVLVEFELAENSRGWIAQNARVVEAE